MREPRPPTSAVPRIADRLQAVQRHRFVGRTLELDTFRLALFDPSLGSCLLYVHGPGGIGKTALVHEYARAAAEAGVRTAYIDGRSSDASPTGVLLALSASLGVGGASDPLEALASLPRSVLLVDSYEALAPVDRWLQCTLLPALPASTVVVLAGRNPPAAGWRAEPGWRDVLRVLALRNLSPGESRAFLRGSGISEAHHKHVLDFTHGHPLALCLVSDVLAHGGQEAPFVPRHEPDVVRVLLEKFVEQVPGPVYRQALRLAAQVRVTHEPLLASVFPGADPRDLFDWLGGLSFMEHGPHGLVPHDLAREVLEADFQWRDPVGYWDLLARTRHYLLDRLHHGRGMEQQRAFLDGMFLMRRLPMIRPIFEWRYATDCYGEPAEPDDLTGILEMVTSHEGPESARIAEHWFQRQPHGFTAVRGAQGRLAGFNLLLDLHEASAADLAADPGSRVAWEYAQRHVPPRPGEEVLNQRMWMDHEAYQYPSPTQIVVASILVTTIINRPRLAWSFHPRYDAEFYRPYMRFTGYERCREADFETDGRRYANWARDWRVEPASAWLAGIAERGLQLIRGEAPKPPAPKPLLLVLSEQDFARAVHQALRDFCRPAALAASPLLRSRVVVDRGGVNPAPTVLKALLQEAADSLRGVPRTEKFCRALEVTYLEPARSQERAAEQLGLPFNTYRYQLSKGIAHITAWLWQRELRGPDV
jgi:hypothetical protein